MQTFRFEVQKKESLEQSELSLLNREWGLCLKGFEIRDVYWIEVEDHQEDLLFQIAGKVFCDPVIEKLIVKEDLPVQYDLIAERRFRAGVTDNPGHSAEQALRLFELDHCRVSTGTLYLFKNETNKEKIDFYCKNTFYNSLIEDFTFLAPAQVSQRFQNARMIDVKLERQEVREICLDLSDDDLMKLSDERLLALNLEEMRFIREHYSKQKENRALKGLGAWPTDVELEVIAQTWSEHCKHKIFNAEIEFEDQRIKSLFKSYIKKATKDIQDKRGIDWLKSVFHDNAGIVRFDENLDLCLKVETHNSPSALDPYGGALTGILGVNRDILGCGLGARPLANTDVFCVAPLNLFDENSQERPTKLLAPRQILKGIHRGVKDGGNKSGIPTVNGAIVFDRDYAGKPLVYCGTLGALPHNLPDGRATSLKEPKVGDYVVMVGGAVGADGIHGATFSSLDLNENSPSTAVQIGDPLTQKRVSDFLLEARDLGLYNCITDNGAGGLSSSVGEMATLVGGARIDLAKCPTKYPGLSAYEIMISESQERMTLAVPEENWESFKSLALKREVQACAIGEFTDHGSLDVYWLEECVASLDLRFLHEALPPMQLKARWTGPFQRDDWLTEKSKPALPEFELSEVLKTLKIMLGRYNIASKEYWVRQYDHEVQAATVVKPFTGASQKGVNDGGVIDLEVHGGVKGNGVALGSGLAPRVALYDPKQMAMHSVDEAVRNIVATGANPNMICLLDNFCWPDPIKSDRNPNGERQLGALVMSCQGLYEACLSYGAPLVSGKDSMKNNYRGPNARGEQIHIAVLPTLLVTAMGQTPLEAVVTSDFKQIGDEIFLLGYEQVGLAASELAEVYLADEKLPQVDLEKNKKLYDDLHNLMKKKLIQSCHDLSDGGLLVALSESMIGSGLGAMIDITEDNWSSLFGEAPGRFIVSVRPDDSEQLKNIDFVKRLGTVQELKELTLKKGSECQKIDLNELQEAWEGGSW